MQINFVATVYGKIPFDELLLESLPEKPSFELHNLYEIGHLSEIKSQARIPLKFDPKLAYFTGYFFGDRGLKDINKAYLKTKRFEYKIKIAGEFFLQIKFIQNIFTELFGISPPIRCAKEEKMFYIDPTNKLVYQFLTGVFELPSGPKANYLKTPNIIKNADKEIKQWFVRGVFDADGDTRAVEGGFKSQPRIKLRMKSKPFIYEMKDLLAESFNVSINGPYFDKVTDSAYIQVERHADIISLGKKKLFFHPIKRWRLEKICSMLSKKLN